MTVGVDQAMLGRFGFCHYLVEPRGFEPLTSAVQVPVRGDGAAASRG